MEAAHKQTSALIDICVQGLGSNQYGGSQDENLTRWLGFLYFASRGEGLFCWLWVRWSLFCSSVVVMSRRWICLFVAMVLSLMCVESVCSAPPCLGEDFAGTGAACNMDYCLLQGPRNAVTRGEGVHRQKAHCDCRASRRCYHPPACPRPHWFHVQHAALPTNHQFTGKSAKSAKGVQAHYETI